MLLALVFMLVGVASAQPNYPPQQRIALPITGLDQFNTRSLVPALSLSFSNGDFVVEGRGVTRDNVDVSPRYTQEGSIQGDGLKFGSKRAGFLSINSVDLRGPGFLDNIPSGLLFKMRYNFGNHTSFCVGSCNSFDLDAPPTTCGVDPNAYRMYADEPAVLFSNYVDTYSSNILLTVTRTEGSTKQMVTSPGCDTQVIYTFTLNYGQSGGFVIWNVYSYYGIWLEDGNDHDIVLTLPQNPVRTPESVAFNLLYIDGVYICWDPVLTPRLPDPAPTWYCKNQPGTDGQANGHFLQENDLSAPCIFSRFYFGQTPQGWASPNPATSVPSQPYDFTYDHLNVTLKRFEVWNYQGSPQPDDPFFCGTGDKCFYYRGSPWCRSEPSYNDLSQIYHRDPVTCNVALGPICNDVGSKTSCGYPGDACGATEDCCNGVCRSLTDAGTCGSCGSACDPDQLCCNMQCISPNSDPNNCYGCGNVCPNGGDCCDLLQGCTGTDRHCGSCGQSCFDFNGRGNDFHCCENDGGYSCFDFLGSGAPNIKNCGACGNACQGGAVCCSGDCVFIGDNENCADCGDVCETAGDGIQKACCNNQCVTLDTDTHCGSCGHNCEVVGLMMGKTNLHCCDGLCVEWGTVQNSCGCPSTDCQQQFNELLGVTTFHCCTDGNMPPQEIPQCLDYTREQACGGCGNICNPTSSLCCPDSTVTAGYSCADVTTQHVCGDCNTDCGPIDQLSISACCSITGLPGIGVGCVALGTFTDCNDCGDACDPMNTDRCCPEITFPMPGVQTQYTCRDTQIDAQYCGSSCTDCTQGGTVANMFCCLGVCTNIDSSLMLCGCQGACGTAPFPLNIACCDKGQTGPALPDYHVCTPLQTNTDCSACGDSCNVPDSQCCATTMDPTVSSCTDITSDIFNCGNCGNVCSIGTEACCDSICSDVTSILACGDCSTACDPKTQFCCLQPMSATYGCTNFLTADTACGCPNDPVDCTAIPPPDENHPGTFTCCKGFCVPTWENCFD